MNRRYLLVPWMLVTVGGMVVLLTTHLYKSSPSVSAANRSTPYQSEQTGVDYALYLPFISAADIPIILTFEANVPIADPGDTITLTWDTANVVTATILRMSPGGPIVQFWDVPPSGLLSYTIGLHERYFVPFLLSVSSQSGHYTGQYLSVPLTCPETWFFSPAPDGCPGGPALYSAGAEQPFQEGYMVWVGEQSLIYVLFDDNIFSPRWAIYPDTWEEGEELCDPGPPPPGYSQPQRGFGKVWCEEPGVRDRMGWAVDAEVGYETAVQHNAAPKYTTIYVRAADGNVWKLLPERSGWEKIMVD